MNTKVLDCCYFSLLFRDFGDSPWLPAAVLPLRRRRKTKRGSRAGLLVRLRKRENRPSLPSILLANVQSMENKLDELRSRITFQRDIKNCNVFILTETWLNPAIPDSAIVPDGFSIFRQDRTASSGKSHREHLMISCRAFHLPREFTSVVCRQQHGTRSAVWDY